MDDISAAASCNKAVYQPISNSTQSKKRTILSCDQARAIFMSKPTLPASKMLHAATLAKFYGVSPKTIRDIWIGRTWYRETYFLDASKPASSERLQKKPGRPLGAKDIKPRTKRHSSHIQLEQQYFFHHEMNFGAEFTALGSIDSDFDIEPDSPHFALSSDPREMEQEHEPAEQASGLWSSQDAQVKAPVDWADYLSDGWAALSPFTDPFHDDWAHWPTV